MKYPVISQLSSAQLSSAQLSSAQLSSKPDSVRTSTFRLIGRDLTRVVGIALFSALVTACGGGSSSSSSSNPDINSPDINSPDINSPDIRKTRYELGEARPELGASTPQPLATGAQDESLSDGEERTFQRGGFVWDFSYDSPSDRTSDRTETVDRCDGRAANRSCPSFRSEAKFTRDADGSDYTLTYRQERQIRHDENGVTLATPYISDVIHTIELTTAVNVADAQTRIDTIRAATGLASTPVAVRGRQSKKEGHGWICGSGTNCYEGWRADFYEADYVGFGIWAGNGEDFFDSAADDVWSDWITSGAYYGLATPANDVPVSGTATYSGIASGLYLRGDYLNERLDGDDRYRVMGDVELNANFGAGTISGTANLDAFNLDYSALSGSNEVVVVLSNGDIAEIGEGDSAFKRFDGADAATISTAGTGVLDELTVGTSGDFGGAFFGPNAEEIAAGVFILKRSGGVTEAGLRFNFIARDEAKP